MDATRRNFLIGAAGLVAMLPRALSAAPLPGELIIQPVTPSSGQNNDYSRFSNQGMNGLPTGAVRLEPVHGLRIDIYLPPRVTQGHVVVFSHGEFEVPQNYESLLAHWASQGFIVMAPLHDDSLIKNGLEAFKGNGDEDGKWDLGSVVNDPRTWLSRTRTCSAVLDVLPKLEQTSGIRFLDERPIIAGHGLGAYTAQLLMGVHASTPAGDLHVPDPRFYGGMLLSPQGAGILGLSDASWEGVTRPLMVVTGNGDKDLTNQDPNIKLEPYAFSPPGNKHLAWFHNISATIYSGQQVRQGTPQELVFQDLLAVTTAFLVSYGDYDQKVFGELSGDFFETASARRMEVKYR